MQKYTDSPTFSLSAIVPAFNEELSIAEAIWNISTVVESSVADYEIIVVNDGSRDSTLEIARSVAHENPHIIVIDLPKNLGFGGAVKAGLAHSTKDVVTYFPADYPLTQMDIGVYMYLSIFYDIVIGYRRERRLGMPWRRRIVSEVFHLLINLLFRLNFYDVNWIHFYKRKDVGSYLGESNGVFFLAENLIRARARGHSICGVDVPFVDRTKGTATGIKVRTILITARDILRFFWNFECKRGVKEGRRNRFVDHTITRTADVAVKGKSGYRHRNEG